MAMAFAKLCLLSGHVSLTYFSRQIIPNIVGNVGDFALVRGLVQQWKGQMYTYSMDIHCTEG